MKKIYYSLMVILLTAIFQAQSIAGTNADQLDMDNYAVWAGYGFIILLTICLFYFLHYSTTRIEEPVKVKVKSDAKSSVPVSFSGAVYAQFRFAMYAAVSLMLLNIVIFMLLII